MNTHRRNCEMHRSVWDFCLPPMSVFCLLFFSLSSFFGLLLSFCFFRFYVKGIYKGRSYPEKTSPSNRNNRKKLDWFESVRTFALDSERPKNPICSIQNSSFTSRIEQVIDVFSVPRTPFIPLTELVELDLRIYRNYVVGILYIRC